MPLLTKMIILRNIQSDSSEFSEVFETEDKHLKYIVNIEKNITDLLKDLKNTEVIYETFYKS